MVEREKRKESIKGMGWGYYPIDPKYKGEDFRAGVMPTLPAHIDLNTHYVLVGVEPTCMFKPGTEPKELDFFHWDNSMQPWLRHVGPANRTGHKLWSRLTYKGWCMPRDSLPDENHRARVNRTLFDESQGEIRDIAQLWGGNRPTQLPKRKHALVCASSLRNHREFFNESQADWLKRVTDELKRQGYTYTIRHKESVKGRKTNQTTDQIKREGCDLVVANYSACASEAAPIGVAVVTTTDQSPARAVSTPWPHFCNGVIREFTEQDIDRWITRLCAYTYFRTELSSLSWIDVHPKAAHLKAKRYEA